MLPSMAVSPSHPRVYLWNRRCGWPTPLAIHLELSGNSWTSCAGGILSDATRCNAARHIIAHPNPWYASQGAWPTAATLCAPEEFKSLCCKISLSLSTFWDSKFELMVSSRQFYVYRYYWLVRKYSYYLFYSILYWIKFQIKIITCIWDLLSKGSL